MDAALKWFTRIWIGLVILANITGIAGFAINAQSIWDWVDQVQRAYSPFNIASHGLNLLLVFPAILTHFWRKKRNTKAANGQ